MQDIHTDKEKKRKQEARTVMGKYKSSRNKKQHDLNDKEVVQDKEVSIQLFALASFSTVTTPEADEVVPLRLVGLGLQNTTVPQHSSGRTLRRQIHKYFLQVISNIF